MRMIPVCPVSVRQQLVTAIQHTPADLPSLLSDVEVVPGSQRKFEMKTKKRVEIHTGTFLPRQSGTESPRRLHPVQRSYVETSRASARKVDIRMGC